MGGCKVDAEIPKLITAEPSAGEKEQEGEEEEEGEEGDGREEVAVAVTGTIYLPYYPNFASRCCRHAWRSLPADDETDGEQSMRHSQWLLSIKRRQFNLLFALVLTLALACIIWFDLPVRPFLLGGISAMIGGAVAHPLDLIKVRLQVPDDEGRKPAGVLAVALAIFESAGIFGFFRGLGAALLRQFVYTGTRFAVYESFKTRVHNRMIVAMFAGIVGAIAGCPAEVILVRAQASVAAPIAHAGSGPKGAGDSSRKVGAPMTLDQILVDEGVLALYAGLLPLCLRSAVVTIGQMAGYDQVLDVLSSHFGFNQWFKFVAAVCAGFIAAALSNPIDVIKTRMQVQGTKSMSYTGTIDCLFRVVRNEGIFTLLSGITPTCMRMVPYVSIMMLMNSMLTEIV